MRFHCGDLGKNGLAFHRYHLGRELWVTPERLEQIRLTTNACGRKSWKRRSKIILARRKVRFQNDPTLRKRSLQCTIAWQKRNRDRCKIARDKWRAKPGSIDKAKQAYQNWVNKPEGRLVRRQVTRRYLKTINGSIVNRVRSRIAVALKRGYTKSASTIELIGCSINDLKLHLESQFDVGMSWNNMGKWEIDHRVPLASFNLADPEQQKLAFNYHNCRPMWKEANRQKSDKVEGELFRGRELRKIIPFKAA